jgi:peptide/nickel transport system substrate-binding protein
LAGAAVLSIALAGCTSASSSSTGTGAGGAPTLVSVTDPATATKQVASVTWNLPYEPASLDPIKTQVFSDAPVTSNMCESLLKVQPDLTVAPNLALSYTQQNATVWTYKLRPGVTFWDGSPMTSADVVASLQRNLDPNSGSYWSLEYKNVKSIAAKGSDEVVITMNHPDALLNMALSTSAGAVSKASALAAAGANYGDSKTGLECTGPFKFTSWKPGDSITMTRNNSYWNKQGLPLVNQITFKFVSDPNTISSGLASGELQGMYEVPAASIPQLRTATSGKFYLGPSTASLDMIPTERQGPMHDARIRQALYWALDRAAVASGVYNGAATPAISFVNPGIGYGKSVFDAYFASRPPAKVDLDKAKQLVTEAGSPTTPIQLATSPDPSLTTVANAIAAAGQSLGLNITVVTLTPAENDQLYFDPKLRDQYDAFLNVQWTPVTDPLEELDFVTKGAFTNYGLYDNPQFEKAFADALGVVPPDARAAATVKALTIIDADLPWVPIVSLPVPTFINSQLTGVPTSWAFLYGQWAQGLGGK